MAALHPILLSFFQQNGLMSASAIDDVLSVFAERHASRNQLLLKEGMVANDYMILQSGCLRAYTHNTEGNEVTTAFYAPGSAVFEVASFFRRIPSKENIEALTDSQGWVLNFDGLNRLFHTHPSFREFGRMILVKSFAALKERMLSMITETAEQRYLHLLETNPGIFQNAPLKQIASYLGVTDTSLSRIRKDLSKRTNF